MMDTRKRLLSFIFLVMEFFLIGIALWPACWIALNYSAKANTAMDWVFLILAIFLVFNCAYLVALLFIRIIIPKPKEGFFPARPGGRPPRGAFLFLLNALLIEARFMPPWATCFSGHLVNVFPFSYFFRRFFGPHTPSATLGDTIRWLDPYMVEAGQNVQFGFGCTVIGHHFDNRGMYIRKVRIGDHVVIGGETTIMAGVQIGHHAVVGNRSVVPPGTVIAPYEFWAGNPVKKIKQLKQNRSECCTKN